MSVIDTDQIWRALGSFYELFPESERVYWSTFWEAWADIVSDLWGYAFQVDRGKSLYATSPTFERRHVRLELANMRQTSMQTFSVISVGQRVGGAWVVRGYVPRSQRVFAAEDIPASGAIRIGVDVIDYVSVTVDVVESGQYAGLVREASFVLASAPPHDYSDSPEFNDHFDVDAANMYVRVDHVGGEAIVDAVLIDATSPVTVNDTGRLVLGTSGVNLEVVEYKSVVVIGDRYVFTLADTFQSPDTSVNVVAYGHPAGETMTVYRYDDERWTSQVSGWARVSTNGTAKFVIDNDDGAMSAQPPSSAALIGAVKMKDNVDFDIAVSAAVSSWSTMPATAAEARRRAVARVNIGSLKFVIGHETYRDGGGVVTERMVWGAEGSESNAVATVPASFDARFKRVGSQLELLYRGPDGGDFELLATATVTGQRATMDLVVSESGGGSAAIVAFDDVVRRLGEVVGSQRLEDTFDAGDRYPYVYDIDVNVVGAPDGLRDYPRLRSEPMTVYADVSEDDGSIQAVGADGFEPGGVNPAGVITIADRAIVYDNFIRRGDVFEFQVRGKIDPDVMPLAAGTDMTVDTRAIDDFQLPGDGTVLMRELATRDSVWAPLAYVDYHHVQNHYGQLTKLYADVSTETYLRRVQGVWAALMSGPSARSVKSGLALTMGLPVAQVDGTVTDVIEERDVLGRLTRRAVVVSGNSQSVTHELRVDIPLIDWVVVVGQRVERFQPLTTGIEVLDSVIDPLWYQRFVGLSELERWNTFGVFVAVEAINADASVEDAVRFALRVKPTWTKVLIRFLLTSGNEDLSEDVDDDLFAAHVADVCEDMSFDEGPAPDDPEQTLRLGEGHKLGQGKTLGGSGLWHFATMDEFVVKAAGGGLQTTAGSAIVTVPSPSLAVPGDVLLVTGATQASDNGLFKITAVAGNQLTLQHTFQLTESVANWQTRDYLSLGEGAVLGVISAYRCHNQHDQNLPSTFLDAYEIVNVSV